MLAWIYLNSYVHCSRGYSYLNTFESILVLRVFFFLKTSYVAGSVLPSLGCFTPVDLIYQKLMTSLLSLCSVCSFKILLYIFLLKVRYLQFLLLN